MSDFVKTVTLNKGLVTGVAGGAFSQSIVSAAGTVTLVNDSASPGASKCYSTDGAGVKGWNSFPAGSTPGGSDQQVQYNSSGSFAGDVDFTWDHTSRILILGATNGAQANFYNAGSTKSVIICDAGSASALLAQDASNTVKLCNGTAIDLSATGGDIKTDTTVGTKIGTGTTQKLGFFNASPVAQQTASGATGYSAVGGGNVQVNDTFTGGVGATAYKIDDVVNALKNLGLIAS